jgi:hypothetical protein
MAKLLVSDDVVTVSLSAIEKAEARRPAGRRGRPTGQAG